MQISSQQSADQQITDQIRYSVFIFISRFLASKLEASLAVYLYEYEF